MEGWIIELVDTNNNGIPDAFENRLSISEILNAPSGSLDCDRDSAVVEMEIKERAPKKGELYISQGRINKARFDYGKYGDFKTLIIRRIIAGNPPITEG